MCIDVCKSQNVVVFNELGTPKFKKKVRRCQRCGATVRAVVTHDQRILPWIMWVLFFFSVRIANRLLICNFQPSRASLDSFG